ncbi:ABC transporter substrate-binding protein [Ruminococcus sp.]|uniref:ABC transporter substrate-binding protein n=1 Tax=Ruminococcus sp. TaxID=41978 RepID=UPI0025CC946B|nr:ABC transporter substrate-binding protein [Ruminococcus sp.]MBQ8965076.1 carbohydrate ABC transporter substrate-binding protein [Ruminococcus sp.]
MVKHFFRRTAAVMTAAAVTAGLCSCHERFIKDTDERVEISFSWWGTDDRNERTLEGLRKFSAEKGITVRPEYSEFSGFKSKMDTQIYSGTEADVMQLNYDWFYQYGRKGEEFYDLSTLKGLDLSTYPESSLVCGRIDGTLQAIPYGFNSLTFIYNKTLLDSYGIAPPATWDELFEAETALRRDGVSILGLTDKCFWLVSCAYLEQTTGHRAFDEDGNLQLKTDDMVVMLDFSRKLIKEKVTGLGREYDRRDFSMLRMAGTVSWASDSGYFDETARDLKMELAVGPYITTEDYVGYGWYEKPTGLYAVRKDTKNPDESGELLDYLVNSPDMASSLGMSKGVPVSRAAEEALEARGMLDGVEYEANRKMKSEGRLKTMSPAMENSELIDIYIDALNSVYYNSYTVTTAANTALEKMYQVKL